MKKITFLIIFQCVIGTLLAQTSFKNSEKINDEWKFLMGDITNAALIDFDDAKWRTVDLPHDWSIEGPLSPNLASATGYLPGGIAWYRKTLDISADNSDKKIYIYFEGIYRNGEVFVNGTSLGMRPNGYVSYYYDITPHIKFGEKNVVAVRVDHSKYIDSRWYTGSGIYRDVYLIYKNPVHFKPWGVYYTTPEVMDQRATINIETSINNSTGKKKSVIVIHEIFDSNEKSVAKISKKVNISTDKIEILTQQLKIKKPHLWSVESPYLYQLKSSIYQDKKLLDQSIQYVGIRTLNFDADRGFSLNGQPIKIQGVCLHHDAGCLGAAVPKEVWERRFKSLKKLGCNAVRTSHNPQAPIFYDLCDQLGLLVLAEAFDEWEFPKKKWIEGWNVGTPGFDGHAEFFEQWGETDLRDMILRDRNHPSIFMWSIGNEVDYPNDPYSHPILDKEGIEQQHTWGYMPEQPNAERLGAIAKRLVAVIKKLDTTRPVTAGLAGPVMSNETDYPGALDVVGYNYTERRYSKDHETYPKRILYGSENSHSMQAWKVVCDNDYIFGQFLWTGIDYLGEARPWPSRGSSSGLLDLAGFKKPRGYFRESLWSNKPMIYLGTYKNRRNNRWLSSDADPVWNYNNEETIKVVCYTNCQKAQLLLNNEKIGEAKVYNDQTGIIDWDIPYQPGKLEVIGYNSEKESARYSMETSKQPYAIQAKTLNETCCSDYGIMQIELQITDVDGKPVFLSDNEITCRIEGPVRLLGLEANNKRDMGDYSDNRQRVYNGKMIAYLQSTGTNGNAKITFTSPWLEQAIVEFEIR